MMVSSEHKGESFDHASESFIPCYAIYMLLCWILSCYSMPLLYVDDLLVKVKFSMLRLYLPIWYLMRLHLLLYSCWEPWLYKCVWLVSIIDLNLATTSSRLSCYLQSTSYPVPMLRFYIFFADPGVGGRGSQVWVW